MVNALLAERERGLVMEYAPRSLADISRLGGTLTGTTRFDIEKGMFFNGSSTYVTVKPSFQPFNTGFWSCVIEFTPNFLSTDGVERYFFRAAGNIFHALKAANYFVLLCNGANALITPVADLVPHWKLNQRNVMVIEGCSSGGTNKLYLNGVLIDSEVSPWTAAQVTSVVIGYNGAYTGFIKSVKFFRHNSASELLTAQEAKDFYNHSTFQYRNKATCILPFSAATHDPTNARTLDVSPNGRHFQFGDGSTASTFPTKLSTRGYSFDGGDYFRSAAALSDTYSVVALVKRSTAATGVLFGCNPTGSISVSAAGVLASSSGTKYVNGLLSTTVPIGSVNLVCVTGISLVNSSFTYIGTKDGSDKWNGSIFYFALYPFALTPLQIKAEYLYAMQNAQKV